LLLLLLLLLLLCTFLFALWADYQRARPNLHQLANTATCPSCIAWPPYSERRATAESRRT
jgi:hypothetical protein